MSRHFRSAVEILSQIATILESFILVVALGLVAWVILSNRQPAAAADANPSGGVRPPAPDPVTVVDDVIASDSDVGRAEQRAKIAIVEFSDFQCPFCGRHSRDVLPTIERRYVQPGLAQYIFRHFPLQAIHPLASAAAKASECARSQGAFWTMHDVLFQNQSRLQSDGFQPFVAQAGLDRALFDSCLANDAAAVAIRRDIAEAHRLSVTSTPTFFLGFELNDRIKLVRRINGAQPVDVFSRMLDELLKAPQPSQ
jgi:protein-disulfide isomerase